MDLNFNFLQQIKINNQSIQNQFSILPNNLNHNFISTPSNQYFNIDPIFIHDKKLVQSELVDNQQVEIEPYRVIDKNQISQRFLFLKRSYDKTNKNTPRLLVKLFLKYLNKYENDYPSYIYEIVKNQCQKLKQWNQKQRKNVYGIHHLNFLFSNDTIFTKEGTKINRKIFRKILAYYSLNHINQPRSQTKQNKIYYYKACKIFSLRCISKRLVNRNQTK